MQAIQREVEARELSDNTKADRGKMSKPAPHIPSAAALTAEGGNGKPLGAKKCACCGHPHFSASCELKVHPVNERNFKTRQTMFCVLTSWSLCPSMSFFEVVPSLQRSASSVNQRFTTRIGNHGTKEQEGGQKKPPEQKTPEANADKNTTMTAYQHSITGATQVRCKVLLQTATTYAYSKLQDAVIPERILMDSGSQRSYVTESLYNYGRDSTRNGWPGSSQQRIWMDSFMQEKPVVSHLSKT